MLPVEQGTPLLTLKDDGNFSRAARNMGQLCYQEELWEIGKTRVNLWICKKLGGIASKSKNIGFVFDELQSILG